MLLGTGETKPSALSILLSTHFNCKRFYLLSLLKPFQTLSVHLPTFWKIMCPPVTYTRNNWLDRCLNWNIVRCNNKMNLKLNQYAFWKGLSWLLTITATSCNVFDRSVAEFMTFRLSRVLRLEGRVPFVPGNGKCQLNWCVSQSSFKVSALKPKPKWLFWSAATTETQ